MTTRTRTQTIRNLTSVASQYGYIDAVQGSCAASPGPAIVPFALWNSSATYKVAFQENSMTDVVTKDFHRIKAQGGIVNNAMSQTKVEELETPCNVRHGALSCLWGCTPARWYGYRRIKATGQRSVGSISGAHLSPPVLDTVSLQDLTVTQAYERIGNDQILSLAALAELESTVGGISDLLLKATRIFLHVKRKEYKKLKREISVKELQNVYLNARYNLRPLYYDIVALTKILTEKIRKTPPRQTFRSSVIDTKSLTPVSAEKVVLSQGGTALYAIATRTASTDVVVRAGVLTAADQASYSSILGFNALVDTAWDLVPWSFILDWFVNVGDTLLAWVPVMGFKALASWVTISKIETQLTTVSYGRSVFTRYSSYDYQQDGDSSLSTGSYAKIVETKTRVPEPSRPIIPQFNLKLNPLKILDLAAILNGLRSNDLRKNMTSRF